ncbi:glycosyl hydrolase family 18 protein [Paenibacillus flagellatus]|uniref:Glycoside hydrolase n=1 Tax=Paenibacillus flagellatus TaxID=2211139 RepID=A0A2V5KXS0_9BACL|nr:glycosyl hydrolase family 18 protein [Paenibacillus flagellatus]PYI57297.1 glycoside hydrolase [Paenibacillus flagellatus]
MKRYGKRVAAALGTALLLTIGGAGQSFAYDARLKTYSDMAVGDWAAPSVYTLSSMKIVDGYEDGTFRPDAALSREAFVKLLVEAVPPRPQAGGAAGAAPLADVGADRWSYEPIRRAHEAGWLDTLVRDGAFGPDKGMTREEVAALAGAALLADAKPEERTRWLQTEWTTTRDKVPFGDAADIEPRLAPYAYRTVASGVMLGDDLGLFRPKDALTRREAAAIVERMIGVRTAETPLEIAAFYSAGGPYKDTARFSAAGEAIFDWAKLEYAGGGSGTAKAALTLPADWKDVLQAADRSKTAKRLMVFANTKQQKLADFLQDKPARAAFVASVRETLADPAYGFAGVCIDFEGLTEPTQREPYTELLRELKAAIGNASLTVAVPPSDYYAGYDYKAIGELADRVVLMAYDFTHAASGLPSAPLPLVGMTVKEALLDIPPGKLLLGISKQANQWTTKPDGTVDFFPSPAIDAVEKRLADPNTRTEQALPYFLERITFTDDRGSHLLWYEDAESIGKKIRLAQSFGLRGVALWQLNQLTPEDWSVAAAHSEKRAR